MDKRKMRNKKTKQRNKGLKQRGTQNFTAVRTWFRCDVYPERHPEDAHEIEEHFYVVSQKGNTISEADVLAKHQDKFPYHTVIDYQIGRPWNYMRDRYGHRI